MSSGKATQFDKYYVQGVRGSGGLGTVYRTRDLGLDRIVALKVIHSHLASQPHFYERFMGVMQQMARLDHPHIVKIFDFATSRNPLYFVMPYYDQNLRLLLGRQQAGKVEAGITAVIGTQAANALHFAHQQNMLHGNIKPENVLLATNTAVTNGAAQQALLVDFGLARLLEDAGNNATPAFSGAWAYMAPELVNGSPLSPQSDIYALGVVLYELVTGQLPFQINSLQDALRKESHAVPLEPLAHAPTRLRDALVQAMDVDVNGRFSSAEQFALALQGLGTLAGTLNLGGQRRDGTLFGTLPTQPQSEETPQIEIGGGQTVPEGSAGGDHISIRQMPSKTFPLLKEQAIVRIGRSRQNDIILPSSEVMDQHATLKRTVEGWEVRDLESNSGVYLDDNRLLPDHEEVWKPEQTLKIGPYTLELNATTGALALDQSEIVAWLEPSSLFTDLQPGQEIIPKLQLHNQGGARDYVQVSMRQLPFDWFRLPQDGVPLGPGEQKSIAVYFTIPQNQTAGTYAYELQVSSVLSPHKEPLKLRGQLGVDKQAGFSAELYPQQIINKGSCQLTIRNAGNVPATFIVQNKSTTSTQGHLIRYGVLPENIKKFDNKGRRSNLKLPTPAIPRSSLLQRYVPALYNNPLTKGLRNVQTGLRRGEQIQRDAGRLAGHWPSRSERRKAQFANALLQRIEIPAGQSGQIEFLVETGRRPFQGNDRIERIQLEVEEEQSKAQQVVEFELTTTPSIRQIPRWVKILGWLLLLLFFCGVCWWGVIPASRQIDNALSLGIYRTATPVGDQDPDRDGLSTSEELERGLDPILDDTDGDGLIDSVDPNPLVWDANGNQNGDGADQSPTRIPDGTPESSESVPDSATPISGLITWGFRNESGGQFLQVGDDANDQAVQATFTLAVPPAPFAAIEQIQSATIIFTESRERRTGEFGSLGNIYLQAMVAERPFGRAIPLANLSSDAQRWQVTLDPQIVALMAQNEAVTFMLFTENPSNLDGMPDQLFFYTISAPDRAQWPVLLINIRAE